jgi:hypothetical protein
MRNPLLSDLCREHRAEPLPPKSDGLMADVDPALRQEILDVSRRQWVPHVHHCDRTDYFWRAIEISERAAMAQSYQVRGGPTNCPDTTNPNTCAAPVSDGKIIRRSPTWRDCAVDRRRFPGQARCSMQEVATATRRPAVLLRSAYREGPALPKAPAPQVMLPCDL